MQTRHDGCLWREANFLAWSQLLTYSFLLKFLKHRFSISRTCSSETGCTLNWNSVTSVSAIYWIFYSINYLLLLYVSCTYILYYIILYHSVLDIVSNCNYKIRTNSSPLTWGKTAMSAKQKINSTANSCFSSFSASSLNINSD